jgi:TetR/AcrR family transcriptional regulator, mexJK operon transcriptional repressor
MTKSNRERLLDAATEVFIEHGYDASVDMLVARAGVARQTFYNHFENKQSLFSEAMRNCVSDILIPLSQHSSDLRASLKKFAQTYRQRALDSQSIAKFRIVTSQAQRFPDLTSDAYALGLGKMLESLTEFLRAAMSQGRMPETDPVFAAEMLLSMLAGLDRTRLLFGVANPPQDEALRVEQIVDGFLRMFAVGQKPVNKK